MSFLDIWKMVKSKRIQFLHTPRNTSDNQQIQMQKKVTTESMTHNPIKKNTTWNQRSTWSSQYNTKYSSIYYWCFLVFCSWIGTNTFFFQFLCLKFWREHLVVAGLCSFHFQIMDWRALTFGFRSSFVAHSSLVQVCSLVPDNLSRLFGLAHGSGRFVMEETQCVNRYAYAW